MLFGVFLDVFFGVLQKNARFFKEFLAINPLVVLLCAIACKVFFRLKNNAKGKGKAKQAKARYKKYMQAVFYMHVKKIFFKNFLIPYIAKIDSRVFYPSNTTKKANGRKDFIFFGVHFFTFYAFLYPIFNNFFKKTHLFFKKNISFFT